MKPKFPEHEIFRAFKKRLLHTKLKLVCTHCGEYSLTKAVKDFEENPSCPKCHSGMISVTSKYKKSENLIKKYFKSKKSNDVIL